MKSISQCAATEVKTKVCREEEGKVICFQHAEYDIVCEVVPIEKCVFAKSEEGRRCDYLFLFDKIKQHYNFLKNKSSLAYYVELKGIELIKACEQLLNSIVKTKDQIADFEIDALVVSSRGFIPKYDNNEYYRDIRRIIKKKIQFEITPCTVSF
jgi:hypothetical protein